MDAVLRAVLIYAALLLLFRIMGKRSLSQATTFDFVLLLVVGEATQQALLGEDFSLTMAVTVIATLIGLDGFADYIGYRFPKVDRIVESVSVLLVDDGKLMTDRMTPANASPSGVWPGHSECSGTTRVRPETCEQPELPQAR